MYVSMYTCIYMVSVERTPVIGYAWGIRFLVVVLSLSCSSSFSLLWRLLCMWAFLVLLTRRLVYRGAVETSCKRCQTNNPS